MRLVFVTAVIVAAGVHTPISAQPQKENSVTLRTLRYQPGTKAQAIAWQNDLRARLAKLLKIDDLQESGHKVPFEPREASSEDMGSFVFRQFALRSTAGRRIDAVMTTPKTGKPPYPAVVCIGGHGSNQFSTYTNGKAFGKRPADPSDLSQLYKGFAAELAAKGYVTIAISVSRHEVYEQGRTLMGERLWDLVRCVDYLQSLPEVDGKRIGCAGLSLGGEMVMWLAAMDTRLKASVSSGFLTVMDQIGTDHNHCMCWEFDGLRELVDFADIYSLIAPRALMCQNGRREPPNDFIPELAEKAMTEIRPIYQAFGAPGAAELLIHDGAHEVDLPSLLRFFEKRL